MPMIDLLHYGRFTAQAELIYVASQTDQRYFGEAMLLTLEFSVTS